MPQALFPSRRTDPNKSLEEFSIEDLTPEDIQNCLPSNIYKKFRLLKRFKHEFKHRIRKDRQIPAYFLQFERGVFEGQGQEEYTGPVFVKKIQKIKEKAVLIWLSNGSIQVNFPDCCVLIYNHVEGSGGGRKQQQLPKLRKAFSEQHTDHNVVKTTEQRDSDLLFAVKNDENGGATETFKIAIFTTSDPQTPKEYNYSPQAEADDPFLFNLDTLPKEAIRAINVLHEAHTIAITRQKKRNLSPDFSKTKGCGSNNSSGSKKAKSSPTLRYLKDTKVALQEKAKFIEQ